MKFEAVERILKNGEKVIIREAIKRDAEALLQTASKYIMQSAYLLATIEEFNLTKYEEMQWIESFTKSKNGILLVAEHKNNIIGNVDVKGETRKKIKHNGLLGIAMPDKWQNIGLGTALMECAIAWAKSNTVIETLWLNVHAANTKAIHLYEKLGFIQAGVQKNYIRNTDGSYTDNIIMMLAVK